MTRRERQDFAEPESFGAIPENRADGFRSEPPNEFGGELVIERDSQTTRDADKRPAFR